jgi:hypothetical protein
VLVSMPQTGQWIVQLSSGRCRVRPVGAAFIALPHQYNPTVGAPTALARCSGPESFATTAAQRRNTAANVPRSVRPVRSSGELMARRRTEALTAHGAGSDEHRMRSRGTQPVDDSGEPVDGPPPPRITRPRVQRYPRPSPGQLLRSRRAFTRGHRQLRVLGRAQRADERYHLEEAEHLALVVAIRHGRIKPAAPSARSPIDQPAPSALTSGLDTAPPPCSWTARS